MTVVGPNTRIIVSWIGRMSARYGGIVVDKELGKTWDWGQALCREMYGPEWMESEYFKEENEREDAYYSTAQRALEWEEKGNWPSWAVKMAERKVSKDEMVEEIKEKIVLRDSVRSAFRNTVERFKKGDT